jgi:hypothetical protein
METKDRLNLQWIYNRLVNHFKESELTIYVARFRHLLNQLRQDEYNEQLIKSTCCDSNVLVVTHDDIKHYECLQCGNLYHYLDIRHKQKKYPFDFELGQKVRVIGENFRFTIGFEFIIKEIIISEHGIFVGDGDRHTNSINVQII